MEDDPDDDFWSHLTSSDREFLIFLAPVREHFRSRPFHIREFGRLNPTAAGHLARAKGLQLHPQPDYSLGEIYAPAPIGSSPASHPVIQGFAS